MKIDLPLLHLKTPSHKTISILHINEVIGASIEVFGADAVIFAYPAQANPNSLSDTNAYGLYIEYSGNTPQWMDVNKFAAKVGGIAGYRVDILLRATSRQSRSAIGEIMRACGIDLNWPEHQSHRSARTVCMMQYPIVRDEIAVSAHRKLSDTQIILGEYRKNQSDSIRTALVFNIKRLAQFVGGPLARSRLLAEGRQTNGSWQADILDCEAAVLIKGGRESLTKVIYAINDLEYDGMDKELIPASDFEAMLNAIGASLRP